MRSAVLADDDMLPARRDDATQENLAGLLFGFDDDDIADVQRTECRRARIHAMKSPASTVGAMLDDGAR